MMLWREKVRRFFLFLSNAKNLIFLFTTGVSVTSLRSFFEMLEDMSVSSEDEDN